MKKFQGFPHVIESQQFTRQWMEEEFFPLTRQMRQFTKGKSAPLAGKEMIALFYEPSTRTRISFGLAMQRLGGIVEETENAGQFSSAVKGESLADTIKVLNEYGPDVIVLRHPQEGSARIAAEVSDVPIINAGDGAGQHPTQALLDIFTLHEELGGIGGISIAFSGDLKHGRTARSLAYLVAKFPEVKMFFVSPPSAKIGKDIKEYLERHNVPFSEHDDLKEVVGKVDALYQTRPQLERGASSNDFEGNGAYLVTSALMEQLQSQSIVMHPLPRVEEIAVEVDTDSRAAYFRQAGNGLCTRMALLQMILG